MEELLQEIRSDLTNLENAALMVASQGLEARIAEAEGVVTLALAQTEKAQAESSALAYAFQEGIIDGKNAEVRKVQTADLIAGNEVVNAYGKRVSDLELADAVRHAQSRYMYDVSRVLLEAIRRQREDTTRTE